MASIIERVRKLFTHAESARAMGSQAEAEAFASKAQALLMEHKLSMSEIALGEEPETIGREDVATPGVSAGWRGVLLEGISRNTFCRVLRLSPNRVAIVGLPSDREVVTYLYTTLVRVAEQQAAAFVPPGSYRITAERNAYRMGFAAGITRQLREKREAAERAERQGTGTGLVLVTATALANTKFAEMFPRTRAGSAAKTSGSHHTYAAGRSAGESHNIQGGITGRTRSTHALNA